MRRIAAVVIAAIAALALCAWVLFLHVPTAEEWLFREMAMRGTGAPEPGLGGTDTLSVLLCGTGSPLPDRDRAGPCALVSAGGHLFLVDAGIASVRNLLLWRVPLDRIDAVLLTHFHSDHIAELGEIRLQTWVAGRKFPLPVYGPPGVETVTDGFNEAYALDTGYRTKHHGAAMLPPRAAALAANPVAIVTGTTAPVLDREGLRITAIRVRHDPATPAYGYRFDFKGRSIVVSGDTAPDEELARAAKGADVLVHEGLSPPMVDIMREALLANHHPRPAKIMHDIPSYHTSPVAAARIANEAGVRLLVFTHLLPMLPTASAEHLFLDGVSTVRPSGVVLGEDGMLFRLRSGTTDIDQTSVD